MAGEEIRIGPFVGGLNTQSDPTSISDTELAEIVNFEQDEDGSLVNRPPIVQAFSFPSLNSETAVWKLLGYYSGPGGANILIASDGVGKTARFDGNSWSTIVSINATAIAQYKDTLWLIVGANDTGSVGGKWSPTTPFVADPNLPRGSAIVAHKDRLWVVPGKAATSGGTRLYLSAIVSADVSWPTSPLIINVGQGDGQNLVDIRVYNNDLVLFKERSTHRFSYSGDPAMGAMQRISASIGASDTGCVAEWQNRVFVMYNSKIFEFSNYIFEEINQKVPLVSSNPSAAIVRPTWLATWADRLFVGYYNYLYVYNIKYGVWSRWETSIENLQFIGGVVPDLSSAPNAPSAFIVQGNATGNPRGYRVTDAISTGVSETMDCYFETKNYDYNSATRMKRLFWVGLDVVSNVPLSITARPVAFSRTVLWSELKKEVWGAVKSRPWGRLVDSDISVTTEVSVSAGTYGRKMAKVLTSLRFRQISFKVRGTTKGDPTTAPLRVFTITTFVRDKQYVSKKIS